MSRFSAGGQDGGLLRDERGLDEGRWRVRDMAGIEPMPEGVGVAGLAAASSPWAGSVFEAGKRTRQTRANLRGRGREAG